MGFGLMTRFIGLSVTASDFTLQFTFTHTHTHTHTVVSTVTSSLLLLGMLVLASTGIPLVSQSVPYLIYQELTAEVHNN
jgi:hypothetical protein